MLTFSIFYISSKCSLATWSTFVRNEGCKNFIVTFFEKQRTWITLQVMLKKYLSEERALNISKFSRLHFYVKKELRFKINFANSPIANPGLNKWLVTERSTMTIDWQDERKHFSTNNEQHCLERRLYIALIEIILQQSFISTNLSLCKIT